MLLPFRTHINSLMIVIDCRLVIECVTNARQRLHICPFILFFVQIDLFALIEIAETVYGADAAEDCGDDSFLPK